jgi:repressor LexA
VQRLVLDAIVTATRDRGYPPSIRELCTVLGMASPATVHQHLEGLVRRGLIRRDPHLPRALVVVDYDGLCSACGQTLPEPDL